MNVVKYTRRYLPLFLVVLGFAVLAAPQVFAQTGLIPCTGLNCQFCHVASLIQSVIRFLIILAVPISAILFAWAGILYFSSAASEDNIHKAKEIFTSAAIGFAIALSAYLVVEVILRTLVKPEFIGNWNKIECVGGRIGTSTAAPRPVAVTPTQPTAPAAAGTCTTCSQITALAVKDGQGSQVEGEYNLRLASFADNLSKYGLQKNNVMVTEGWPPTITHQNSCHTNGTCTDIGLRGATYTVQTVSAVQKAAKDAGLCAVYEPARGRCNGYNSCLSLSTTQSDHFSLYKSGAAGCI